MRRERWKAHAGMVVSQLCSGGYFVISKAALNAGVHQLVFCALRDLIALSLLAPLAFCFERKSQPPLTRRVLFLFFLLGLSGVFGNQLLFLLGLSYTNPTYAAATQPAIPVFTLLLAVLIGRERLNFCRFEGHAKVLGVSICVSGAILMVFFQGPAIFGQDEVDLKATRIGSEAAPHHVHHVGWFVIKSLDFGLNSFHLGVLCFIANCLCMASFLTIQASVLSEYPSSLSVSAYSYTFGVLLIMATATLTTTSSTDWSLTQSELLAVIYAGVIQSALNFYLLTWSNKILGPALVSLYNPLQPVASALLSRIFLQSAIYLGSILGGCLIIAGLYLVTWASYREEQLVMKVEGARMDAGSSQPFIHKDA